MLASLDNPSIETRGVPNRPSLFKRLSDGTKYKPEQVRAAMQRICDSHADIKRFEDCPYVDQKASLQDHKLDTVAQAEELFAELVPNGLRGISNDFIDEVITAIMVHDDGETIGEMSTHSGRTKTAHSESQKALRDLVERCVARLTWALALNEAKCPAETSLFNDFVDKGRAELQAAKEMGKDPIRSAAEFLIQFFNQHQSGLKSIFVDEAGLVVARLMASFSKVEQCKEPVGLVAKGLEKYNTLAYTAHVANHDEVIGPRLRPLLEYVEKSVSGKLRMIQESSSQSIKILISALLNKIAEVEKLIRDKIEDTVVRFVADSERVPAAVTKDGLQGDSLLISSFNQDDLSIAIGDSSPGVTGEKTFLLIGADRLFEKRANRRNVKLLELLHKMEGYFKDWVQSGCNQRVSLREECSV